MEMGVIFDPDNINWDDLLTKVETDTANSGDEEFTSLKIRTLELFISERVLKTH